MSGTVLGILSSAQKICIKNGIQGEKEEQRNKKSRGVFLVYESLIYTGPVNAAS